MMYVILGSVMRRGGGHLSMLLLYPSVLRRGGEQTSFPSPSSPSYHIPHSLLPTCIVFYIHKESLKREGGEKITSGSNAVVLRTKSIIKRDEKRNRTRDQTFKIFNCVTHSRTED